MMLDFTSGKAFVKEDRVGYILDRTVPKLCPSRSNISKWFQTKPKVSWKSGIESTGCNYNIFEFKESWFRNPLLYPLSYGGWRSHGGDACHSGCIYILETCMCKDHFWKLPRNRSQVQSSTFRVKDKEGIKEPKSSLKMLISPNNCQFGSKFWIRPDEADVFLIITHPKCRPGTRREPLNP